MGKAVVVVKAENGRIGIGIGTILILALCLFEYQYCDQNENSWSRLGGSYVWTRTRTESICVVWERDISGG
jgi:hypothetical protein